MVLAFRAIRPRREVIGTRNVDQLITQELVGFGGDMIRRMSNYPPQQPTVSGYRRTGRYGRGWKFGRRRRTRRFISLEVVNNVDYAVRVGGPRRGPRSRRQTREMRRRRWPNITDESRESFRRFRPGIVRILTQQDPRIQRRRFRRVR